MPDLNIYSLLADRESAILEEWVKQQLGATTMRADLISEGELRANSQKFLGALRQSLMETGGQIPGIHSPAFKEVLAVLGDISAARGRKGFSPSETAGFIFSLKQPLFQQLSAAFQGDTAALLKINWDVNQLLDSLGLYTTEVYQSSREEVIRRQQEEMLELSTPVVQLWEGIVAIPLIGTLDSARTSIVMESLLQSIVETRSAIAIIDITGVPTVDTLVAQHLLKTVAAARLMGADCIISGIRPQIAQTMVHLQIDLSTVTTKATMAEALRVAIARSGLAIGRAVRKTVASPTEA
jgi:rsbT co-antagonist protein RsbR